MAQGHCEAVLPTAWRMWLWTDEGNRDLVARHFPSFLGLFDGYDLPIQRADAARYFYMWLYGGVYIDLDTVCLREFESLPLHPDEVTLGFLQPFSSPANRIHECTSTPPVSCLSHHSEGIPNAFLAAPPRHPFFAHVIHSLAGSRNASYRGHRPHPNPSTGPRFLTSRVREWAAMGHGGLRVLRNPIIYNSLWTDRRHWCGWGAARPEEQPTGARLEKFAQCAAMAPEAALTTFWAHGWAVPGGGRGNT